MAKPPIDELGQAVQTFGHGFALQRSIKAPYEFVSAGPLWLLRDPPGGKRPRATEVIVYGISPEEAIEAIREHAPSRHTLSVVHQDENEEADVRQRWKSVGYRSLRRETFFSANSAHWPGGDGNVRQVTTAAEAEAVRKAAGKRQIAEEQRIDGSVRLYAAWRDGKPVGWVRSIATPNAGWVAALFVQEEFRRQGYGEALMRTLLHGDAKHGLDTSVLLASSAGSRLYPRVGYRQIGMLQMFSKIGG